MSLGYYHEQPADVRVRSGNPRADPGTRCARRGRGRRGGQRLHRPADVPGGVRAVGRRTCAPARSGVPARDQRRRAQPERPNDGDVQQCGPWVTCLRRGPHVVSTFPTTYNASQQASERSRTATSSARRSTRTTSAAASAPGAARPSPGRSSPGSWRRRCARPTSRARPGRRPRTRLASSPRLRDGVGPMIEVGARNAGLARRVPVPRATAMATRRAWPSSSPCSPRSCGTPCAGSASIARAPRTSSSRRGWRSSAARTRSPIRRRSWPG